MTDSSTLRLGRSFATTAAAVAGAARMLYSIPVQYHRGDRMTTVTYSHAREHLAELWDTVENEQQPIVLQRRGHEDMALLPAAELASLQETAHLLRSPKNAARLLAAITRSHRGRRPAIDLDRLRAQLGAEKAR